MTADLSSVARETAEARAVDLYPMVDHELHAMNRSRRLRQKAYVKGFTECASRLPSEEDIAVAICVVQGHTGDADCERDYDAARAVLALIGEKISG